MAVRAASATDAGARSGWRRVKTVRFGSDAAGFAQLQRYLDKHSTAATDFLVLLEPTGGYYALALVPTRGMPV